MNTTLLLAASRLSATATTEADPTSTATEAAPASSALLTDGASVGTSGELEMPQLQRLASQRQMAVQLATSLPQRLDDAASKIIQNVGSETGGLHPRFFGNHRAGTEPARVQAHALGTGPELKVVEQQRYLANLNESLDKAIQFATFEPNGEALWDNVRRTVSDFLLNEWQTGALKGDRPEHGYFVRCDRSTMSQNDIDNGRLVVVIGVATLRPAEFVTVRIAALAGSADP